MSRTEIDLPGYVRLLWRRRWAILIVTILVTGSAVVVSSRRTPVFEARADLLMPPRAQSADAGEGIPTEIQVLTSRPVVDAVRKRLGSAPPVSVGQVGVSDVMQVRARSVSRRDAALIANTYANSYIEFRRAGASQALADATGKVQAELSDLQKQIDDLDQKLKSAPATGSTPADQASARQRDALLLQQQADRQRLDQIQFDATVTGGPQLITPAIPPGVPVEPKPLRTGVLAAAVGLMLGLGWALLAERFDDSVKSKEEVEEVVDGVPVLGMIPTYGTRHSHRDHSLVTVYAPTSAAAEAYRSLRTGLQIVAADHPMGTVQVTSPVGGDGKTTTVANLAVTLATAGQRVIVVGCDLRRPMVHQCFGVSNDKGITSVLLDGVALDAALQPVPGQERITVLSSGPGRPDPSELLSSQEFIDLLGALRGRADTVLIDSAPVLPVTDAVVLSARVDAILLLVRMAATTGKQMRRATETLRQVGAPLVGVVVNAEVGEDAPTYGYGYHEARPAGRGGDRRGSGAKRLTPAPWRPGHGPASSEPRGEERRSGTAMRAHTEPDTDRAAAGSHLVAGHRNGSVEGIPTTRPGGQAVPDGDRTPTGRGRLRPYRRP